MRALPASGSRRAPSWTACPEGAGLNIAHEAVDRHADGPRARSTWRCAGSARAARSRLHLRRPRRETSRFANVLHGLGLGRGDLVCVLAARIPSSTSPRSARSRTAASSARSSRRSARSRSARGSTLGHARVLVTTEPLYQRKIAGIRATLPELEHVLLVGEGGAETERAGHARLPAPRWPPPTTRSTIGPTDPEDSALLHFTSGTTGKPKGAVHVHDAVRPTTSPAGSRSTCIPRTSSGAPPIPAG